MSTTTTPASAYAVGVADALGRHDVRSAVADEWLGEARRHGGHWEARSAEDARWDSPGRDPGWFGEFRTRAAAAQGVVDLACSDVAERIREGLESALRGVAEADEDAVTRCVISDALAGRGMTCQLIDDEVRVRLSKPAP